MNYNALRKMVANCVEGSGHDPRFRLNMYRLKKKVKDLGLIPLVYKNEYTSKRVTPDDIPLLMEFFKEDRVEWFDGNKSFLTVIFIKEEDIDDELTELLGDLLYSISPDQDKLYLPDGVKYTKVNGDDKLHYECKRCGKEVMIPKPDTVNTLAKIVGNYPCYTTVVAKWIRPDSISLNIRFRANAVLIAEQDSTSSEDNTTESGESAEEETE